MGDYTPTLEEARIVRRGEPDDAIDLLKGCMVSNQDYTIFFPADRRGLNIRDAYEEGFEEADTGRNFRFYMPPPSRGSKYCKLVITKI